jgi:hypothetical protein
MEIERYFEQIVDPTIADFEANPTSVRHAFLAAVVVFHAIDYLPRETASSSSLRNRFRNECADFAIVDRIAHAFNERPTWLTNAHAELDAAVAAAYGWPADIPEEEALARLFVLNQDKASGQGAAVA